MLFNSAVCSFEKELLKKLSQKSSGVQSEEAVLMKCFKYFDLNNNGTVEPEEFAKAIEKIGIMIPTRQDLDSLFSLYDTEQNGSIDYKEFAQALYGREISQGSTQKSKASPDELVDRLRKKLASRGARGIIGLSKQFRIMDDNHSMSLDKYEFQKAMQDFMLGFSEGEISALFRVFDYDHSGLIDYDEFLRTIRGPMNPFRKGYVQKAFTIMDKDGNGYINLDDLRGVYNAQKCPDVISGKKTEQQVLQEFLETFEVAHNMRNNNAPDHIVTKEEFEEYYNNVSASIDDDSYFAQMMTAAWNLDGSRVTKKGWAADNNSQVQKPAASATARPPRPQEAYGARPQSSAGGARPQTGASQRSNASQSQGGKSNQGGLPPMNYSDAQLVERFRQKLAARGSRGIQGIGRQFKIMDDNGNGLLGLEEFKKGMHDFRIGLEPKDSERLFKIFDTQRDGQISYDEFLRGVRGEMNDFRKAFCEKAFKIMDADGSGVLDIGDIRHKYNAKMCPDVINGKKTEDEVLFEFLDTFQQHHDSTNVKDNVVTLEEWIEYYNGVSMSIDDDAYFELMMNNAWNLDGKKVTKKGWGAAY